MYITCECDILDLGGKEKRSKNMKNEKMQDVYDEISGDISSASFTIEESKRRLIEETSLRNQGLPLPVIEKFEQVVNQLDELFSLLRENT